MFSEGDRFPLISSLLDEIDFRENKSKDDAKLVLLSEEITNLFKKPNAAAQLCQAFEGGLRQRVVQQGQKLPDDLIVNVCKTLKFSIGHSLSLAMCLCNSQVRSLVNEANRIIKQKILEVSSVNNLSDINEDILIALIIFVQNSEETFKVEGFVGFLAIAKLYPFTSQIKSSLLHFGRGKQNDSFEKDILSIQKLTDSSRQRMSVATILEEIGPQSSGTIELFRKTLHNITVKLDEEQIAGVIIVILPRPNVNSDGEKDVQNQWNLEVVAEVLNQECRGLNWVTVVKCLDSPNLIIRCEADYQLLTRLFVRISGASLPVLGLLSAVWNNRPAYLAILTLSANSPRNIVDFSTLVSPEQLMSAEVPAPANLSWLCLPLYARFFDLAASGIPNEVLDILSKAAGSFPEYFLTSLAQVQDPTSGVRSELLRRLLPSFTGLHGSRPTSLSVMRKLFTANSDLLILLCRFALKKAKKVWEISNIDGLLKSLGPQIMRRLEDEGTVDEMLGYWCVKADRSEVNLEEKAMLLLDANPKNARVFVSFAKVHADSLRPRVMNSDGILSFECFAILLRAVQAFPTIVSIDEVRALATIFSQHQQNLQMQQHAFSTQISQVQQSVVSEMGFGESLGNSFGGILNDGSNELARLPSGPDSEEIEALANSYFQKIYSSEIVINDVIVLLRQFKSSTEKREQEIFRCMIHNLFDEYRFFHKYPEKELQVTGRLFGALIQNQLVSSITLGIALRYVLEALRKDPELGEGNDKMFRFGRIALDQFRSRLGEWPQYCSHLIQIPHLARHSPDLFQEAQKALNNPQQQAQSIPQNNDGYSSQVQGSGVNSLQRQLPLNGNSDGVHSQNFAVVNEMDSSNQSSVASVSNEHFPHQRLVSNSAGTPNTSVVTTGSKLPLPVLPQSLTSLSEAVNIEDSVPVVESISRVNEIARMGVVNVDVLNTTMPPESVRDQIHFIINNIAKNNIDAKTNEIREILKPDHFSWFANYLVVKRISTQPNLHPLYLSVLDALDLSPLTKLVLDSAYHNVTKLLQSPNITTSSSERSLLRNLGVWLGQMTLAKNRPLLQKRINLKELLFWGFETGRLIAVCSFVAKIVEGVKESRVFRPPNPWLMAILGIMRELYEIEDLKLNIKFEVQVLCKNINIKIEDIPKGNVLIRCRGPVKDQRNPDFNSKGSIGTPSMIAASPTIQPSPKVAALPSPAMSSSNAPSQPSPYVLEDVSKSSLNLPELLHTALQGLNGLVVVNASLQFFVANPSHRRLVHAAVDRGVREIIQSAVERSVNIAITSTKCLVVKDFATEPDELHVRNGAHLMAASLAGSLALATSKEPLRISIGNHLRTLLTQVISDQSIIEQIVQVCSNDNIDMGASLVEKVAVEKALRDVDDLLATAYQTRKRFREIGQQFIDTSVTQSLGKYPSELNDVLKPGIGGLTAQQMHVYEAFQRIKTCPSPQQQSPSTSVGHLSASSLETRTMLPPPSLNAQLTISQGLEAYQHVLIRIDASLKNVQTQAQGREVTVSMLGTDHDIPHLLRDVNSVTLRVQLSQRSETAMTFAEIVFNRLFDSISSPDALRLEVLVAVLESLREACGGVRQFSPDFIAWLGKYAVLVNNDEISRKMYRLILILLLRAKLLKSADVDIYFVMYIDGGRNLFWLELALSFIRQCLVEGLSSIYEFSNTFDTVTKMRPSNMVLKKQLQKWLTDIKTLTTAQEEQKNTFQSVIGNGTATSTATINVNSVGVRDTAVREHVTVLLDRWLRVWNSVNDQIFGQYLQLMHQYGVLKTEEAADRFFRVATEICTEACIKSSIQGSIDQQSTVLNYTVIDALSKLFLLLVRLADKEASDMNVRVNLLSRILNAIARSVLDDHESKKNGKLVFDQRPYFRLFSNLSHDLGIPDTKVDPNPAIFGLLTAYTQVYLALNPSSVPGFAYGWVQLVSRRSFMPHLLLAKGQKGWPYMHRLLSALLLFLQPFLKFAQLIEPVKKLYKGTLRVLLVLLHDFPEFLCDFHLSLCDLIPLNCVQLRNLILSAFPRSMRLPDPFTPNLKVDVLTESSQSPRILTDYLAPINGIRTHLDSYMASKLPAELPSKLPSILASATGTYNLSLITSLVVYIGSVAIQQVQVGKISLQTDSPSMDIYRHLVSGALDAEGRYIVLNTMANQLRYPNSHTNFFSFVLLNLFFDADGAENGEFLQEQITRVLLERLIVHRPHPWGLLITFIELIKNPRYSFWTKSFTRGAPEIEKVFESIARSCIGPTAAAVIQQQIGDLIV